MMSPNISRPPSPSRDQPDNSVLNADLEAALRNPPLPPHPDMHDTHGTLALRGDKEKLHPFLDIVVDSDQLCLKGTGAEVEPALLSGHIVLQLTEPTSIKEITLHFRGKAKVPPAGNDSYNLSAAGFTYVVCDHNWSFLEGEKKHSHTMKAGRHFFPFHFQIGGHLPCSVITNAFGGASVQYKLRAIASRPGLSHNFQAVVPISIFRSFTYEALEYQQSLEIENTWPGKLMYSLMIPHKAWAAGDTLTAVAKFSPLIKGTRVAAVTSTINETVKLSSRIGHQESTKIMTSAKHIITGGRAVCTEEYQYRHRIPLLYHHNSVSIYRTPQPTPTTPQFQLGHHVTGSGQSSSTPTSGYFPPTPSTPDTQILHLVSPDSGNPSEPGPLNLVDRTRSEFPVEVNEDIVTAIQVNIPQSTTPTHGVEPITVSHRIRWNILIVNPDGHKSELRCSLPLHILDHQFLREARSLTAVTRRLLLGGDLDADSEHRAEDTQLPSYSSHVRDRVPDFHPNIQDYPWTPSSDLHMSPIVSSGNDNLPDSPSVPGTPDVSGNIPLDWVTSELLRQQAAASGCRRTGTRITPPDSHHPTTPNSRTGSRFSSRISSHAASPERGVQTGDATLPSTSASSVHDAHVPGGNTASRNLHNLFHNSMKPFTTLSHPFSLSSRSSSHSSLSSHPTANHAHTHSDPNHARSRRQHGADSSPEMSTPPQSAQHSRSFTEVPDYEVASRGFVCGGVPPLTSMRGLPSYEQASRGSAGASGSGSASEANLTESGALIEHFSHCF